MSNITIVKIKPLKKYPILHRFLAALYERCNIYKTDDMLEYIKDDDVCNYHITSDDSMSIYLRGDRLPTLTEDDEDEYVEIYDSDNGMLVLHFYTDGEIEIEALEYENYPFKEELQTIYSQEEEIRYIFKSDLNEELVVQDKEEVQSVVDSYFNVPRKEVPLIVVDKPAQENHM